MSSHDTYMMMIGVLPAKQLDAVSFLPAHHALSTPHPTATNTAFPQLLILNI